MGRSAPTRGLVAGMLLAWAACAPSTEPRGAAPVAPRAEERGPHPLGPDATLDLGPPPPLLCPDAPAASRPLRLLTRVELDRTLLDLLGDDTRPAQALPPEASLTGFENDAARNHATPVHVEAWLSLAEGVAARAWRDRRDRILPCVPEETGEAACGQMLVESFGRRAFRRPLPDDERAALSGLFEAARSSWGFDKAAELVVTAALQSPRFLYLVEEPDPGGALSPWAMASRLSYFLWASMPDDALLAAAEAGALSTREGVRAEARRMLADPRGREGVRSFFRQWLGLDGLLGIQKDAAAYPSWTPAARASWRASMDAFLDRVLWEGTGRIEELFTAPVHFVDPILAALYDVQGPDHDGFAPVQAPLERAGLLTQPALLALLSASDQSSPVRRGVFVRERILCQPLAPPPPGVAAEPPDPDPTATTRERYAQHTADPTCAGCHALIDPVGFGFEGYDGLGRFRSLENGLPVDASGALTDVEEPAVEGPFVGAVELSARLARSARVRSCIARQVFRFAAGRAEGTADACTLAQLEGALAASSGDLRELFVALAASDAFRAPSRPAPEAE